MESIKGYKRPSLYVPVLVMRNEEIKRLHDLKDAFSHQEVIPFLEIVRDFEKPTPRLGRKKKDGSRGKGSLNEAYMLASMLSEIPEGKHVFAGLYRHLDKCKNQDFPDLFPYVEQLKNDEFYLSKSIALFQFKNVTPVFEMDSGDDTAYASAFLTEAKRLGRSSGIRLNAINMKYNDVLMKLGDDDWLFLNIGESNVDTAYPSISFFEDYGIRGHLIIVGENHPSSLKTTALMPAENEKFLLHGDYFNDIAQYKSISGAGDYCSVKDSLVESIRSKRHYDGKANFLIYHHSKNGYLILTDDANNGAKGYLKVRQQAIQRASEIDPHAMSIIMNDVINGSYGQWNVIGLVHYIYDVLQLVIKDHYQETLSS